MNRYMVSKSAHDTIILNVMDIAGKRLSREDVLNLVTWLMLVNDITFPELQENMQLEQ